MEIAFSCMHLFVLHLDECECVDVLHGRLGELTLRVSYGFGKVLIKFECLYLNFEIL